MNLNQMGPLLMSGIERIMLQPLIPTDGEMTSALINRPSLRYIFTAFVLAVVICALLFRIERQKEAFLASEENGLH